MVELRVGLREVQSSQGRSSAERSRHAIAQRSNPATLESGVFATHVTDRKLAEIHQRFLLGCRTAEKLTTSVVADGQEYASAVSDIEVSMAC